MYEPIEQLEDLSLQPPEIQTQQPLERGNLRGLNLDSELYDRYTEAKDFLDLVLTDSEVSPNQVSTVMNSVNSILKEIVKMQTEVQNAEKVKKLELAMITALKLATPEVQEAFFAEFERLSA